MSQPCQVLSSEPDLKIRDQNWDGSFPLKRGLKLLILVGFTTTYKRKYHWNETNYKQKDKTNYEGLLHSSKIWYIFACKVFKCLEMNQV